MIQPMSRAQVFISYSGHDAFEASLLQYAIESLLAAEKVAAWTYQRDQERSEKDIAAALKQRVRESIATVFLVSPATLEGGASQWMELAYADAFEVKTFILLHHLEYKELQTRERGVPPLLIASQCNAALEWRNIIADIGNLISGASRP